MKKNKRWITLLLLCFLGLMAARVYAQQEEQDEIAQRIRRAKELDVVEWVDDEGYLVEEFYADKNDQILTDMKLEGLIRTMSDEELDAYVDNLNEGITSYSVTSYQKVSQVNPATGSTLYTGVFEVDGILAYCVERSAVTPARGASTGEWISVTNDSLRKVLYYGYNGPEAKGYTYVETALAAGEANGDGDNSLGRRVLAEIQSYSSPPSSFRTWVVRTNGGTTQNLAFYTIVAEKGYGKIKKVSANPSLTNQNPCYSLQGAVYGVYTDTFCQNSVGKLTTDASGLTETLTLEAGTYYAKEIKAPKGYCLSETKITMQVKPLETTVITVQDEPKVFEPDVILQKVDSQTGENVPQGTGSLKDALFSVKYCLTDVEKPDKEWVFATDSQGRICFREDYLVSGDSFWKDQDGDLILPLGTVVVQELKSSNGYRINPDVLVQTVDDSSGLFPVQRITENVIEMEVFKYQENTGEPLEDAVFEHENPDGSVETMSTDSSGILIWKGLNRGVHKVREISPPQGYMHNENEIVFVVDSDNQITVTSEVNEEYGKVHTEITEAGNLKVKIENKVGYRLPDTGSYGMPLLQTIGGILLCRTRREYEKKH